MHDGAIDPSQFGDFQRGPGLGRIPQDEKNFDGAFHGLHHRPATRFACNGLVT